VAAASQVAVVNGADAAVRRLPGGPVLAAAIRPAGGSPEQFGSQSATGASGTAGVSEPAAGSAAPGSVESLLDQNANQNLYFLQLQERVSAESRAYSAMSNILKARHETVKNAIGNIR
jgi:hypothetical protein